MTETPDSSTPESILFVVATPIGNMEDMSPRGRRVLAEADVIAAEDTRVAKKLLSLLGVEKKRLVSYYDEVEKERSEKIIVEMLENPLKVALISDAGTPCISDPGFRLVTRAHEAGITVCPIPGPSALTAIVSAAGLANSRILFVGFLPAKEGDLRSEVESWKGHRGSVCFYESPRRLRETIEVIAECHPQALLAVGRELTKLFEEIFRGTAAEVAAWLENHAALKGEAVIMVDLTHAPAATAADSAQILDQAVSEFRKGATLKDLLRKFAESGLGRKELYRILLEAKDQSDR